MKVLRVIATMDPTWGGPCQGIRNSIPELEKLGIHNEVVSMDAADSDFLGKDPFIIHTPSPAKGPWYYHSELINWLTRNLSRFDAVILHGLWVYPGYAVRKAMERIKGKKPGLFIMPHGMLDPYFQEAKERRLKAFRNVLYWKLIEQKTINKANAVLFTCQQELLLARKPFNPYRPKMEINAGYGIATPPAYSTDMQAAFLSKCPGVKDRPYLLYLSRIHEKKGTDLLIEAYLELQKRLPAKLPALVIAGPGLETSFGKKLVQLSKGNSQNNDICFPGMLTGTAKWGAFYGCEAFLLPSHQENFGIALAEAMACGKPSLITDKVNIWREVQAYQAGLVSSDNLEGISDSLESWATLSHSKREVMSLRALKCFQENFSIRDAAQRLLHSLQQGLHVTA